MFVSHILSANCDTECSRQCRARAEEERQRISEETLALLKMKLEKSFTFPGTPNQILAWAEYNRR